LTYEITVKSGLIYLDGHRPATMAVPGANVRLVLTEDAAMDLARKLSRAASVASLELVRRD
jgi:hypothetical protein